MNHILAFLLEHGDSGIQYRIRREILNEFPSNKELLQLQKKILEKPKVKKIVACRQSDGWIGNELHGGPGKGLDSSVSFLLNYGVERESALLKDVVKVLLEEKEAASYRTTFKGGEALDLGGRGGNKAVKAGILAELGEEDHPLVQDEIGVSLNYLKASLLYHHMDDFSVVNKKQIRYYKPDARFPGSNHFYLLAQTQSWRTPENMELVKKSFAHCLNMMRGNSSAIMFKTGSHFVGPFNLNWNFCDFDISEINHDSYAFVWWLRNLFKLSKIGMIKQLPVLKKPYDYLCQLVKNQDIVKKQNDASLKRYKDILSIEDSWRKKESIFCDIMFYAIITLHYAGYDVKDIGIE